MFKLHDMFCTLPVAMAGLPLSTVQYVMCFRICGFMFPHNGPFGTWLMWHILKATHQGQSVMSAIDYLLVL